MVFQNALNFVVNSDIFQNHIAAKNLSANAVNSVLISHINSEEHGHVYKIYFDYGKEGESNKDLIVAVKILDIDSFRFL